MRVKIRCQDCEHAFSVADDLLGKRVRCPSCGEPVRVVDDSEDDDDLPQRRSKTSKSTKNAGLSKSGRSRNRASSGHGVLIGLGVGGGLLIAGLLGTVIFLLMRGPAGAPIVAGPAPAAPTPAALPAETLKAPVSAEAPPNATASPAVAASETATTVAAAPAGHPPAIVPSPTTPTESLPPVPGHLEPETPVAVGAANVPLPKLSGVPAASADELRLPDLIRRVEPSVVRINVLSTAGASTGSGFVVSDDGTVVTNYHVVTDAKKAEVEFADGTSAKVLGYRHLIPKADIAIISIEVPKGKLRPVPIASDLPQKGESVATFGAPHGLSFTTSEGVISAIRKQDDIQAEMGLDLLGTWLQTTAPISPGNSGGPLVDKFGKVVGMSTMQLSIGQNLNFAVSSLEILEALRNAPLEIKDLKPDDLKPYQNHVSRKLATEEYDTDRGRRLFAEVEEIFLVNMSKSSNFDPTDEIWNRVIVRSKKAVEKSGIELSFGRPAPDAAVLLVFLEMRRSRKGTEGTQELFLRAELICVDPLAKKNVSPSAKVWKDERSVGTVSITAAMTGTVPRSVDENLAKFFSGFKGSYNRAVRAHKEAQVAARSAAANTPAGGKDSSPAENPDQGK